jgi:hypothetical protein
MKSFRHWTPRYIKNRLGLYLYQKKFPKAPWLTKNATEILDSYLKKTDIGLEFGSGRSTIWFAERVQLITSVEHDEAWYEKIENIIKEKRTKNIKYHYFPQDKEKDRGDKTEYVKIINRFKPSSLDFVLVDGIYRDYCELNVLDKIASGGILVIDNANWFLPCNSFAPNSRKIEDGPNGKVWLQVQKHISKWRRIWTSDGVCDTAIFFKPANH